MTALATLERVEPTAMASMVFVRGGRFAMGSDKHYPEERPAREVTVGDFRIDATPVRNRDFAAFVAATGYLTLAERDPDPAQFPDAAPQLLVPGSAVFRMPAGEVDPRQVSWWDYVPHASWRAPDGPGSAADDDHPVVHIAHEDALAYARWAGKELPTEAEWEYAARGGLAGATYAWGEEFEPSGRPMANIWAGKFPHQNLKPTAPGTSPVGAYPANGYGLHDMIGNVWEWTATPWSAHAQTGCCHAPPASLDIPYVLKGGSYLCAWNYCRRFRPSARVAQAADSPTGHIGFRCITRSR